MTSLMSIFDPSMSFAPSLGWFILLVSFLTGSSYWASSHSLLYFMKELSKVLLKLFPLNKVLFISLFLFILNMNLAGLLPFVFSSTSHLSFNLTVSMSLWVGTMLWYAKTNLPQLLSHLTPVGCPLVLAPMLVLIEFVSSMIRPLTLSLRLMANVMAGHMILTLISKGISVMIFMIGFPLFVILVGFLLFELMVALIQSYVFSSLMSLYWEESESSH